MALRLCSSSPFKQTVPSMKYITLMQQRLWDTRYTGGNETRNCFQPLIALERSLFRSTVMEKREQDRIEEIEKNVASLSKSLVERQKDVNMREAYQDIVEKLAEMVR